MHLSMVAVKMGVWIDVMSHQDLARHLGLSSVHFAICLVGLSE